jgi:hypothetical protein
MSRHPICTNLFLSKIKLSKSQIFLHPRRSNGEMELIALSGQVLLLPQDQVFQPDDERLK